MSKYQELYKALLIKMVKNTDTVELRSSMNFMTWFLKD
jgi:hypothetical protein